MLRALIVEDEIPAQLNLMRALNNNFDDIAVVGRLDSVEGAVKWLSDSENVADVVFMDVELSDGKCFEIFKQVKVNANVVITTAYDQYAIQAFKSGSVDYLLKPIDIQELKEAVSRCCERAQKAIDFTKLEQAITSTKEYKKRFAVKVGDRILIIDINDVAYFYSEDKSTLLVTHNNQKYVVDQSLDTLGEGMLDPNLFFRLSRAFIGSISSIKSISKHFSSRLKVNLTPTTDSEIYVSRVRIPEFMRWLEGDGGKSI